MITLTRPQTAISNNIAPQNIEAEEAILGGILLDPTAIAIVSNILPSEQAFYVHAHQIIYKACLTLHKKNQLTDLMAVTSYLQDKKKLEEVGNTLKLVQLLDRTVSAVNVDRYAQLIAEKWTRRQIIALGHNIIDAGYDTFNDIAELVESLHAETSQFKCETKKESSINEVIAMRYQKIIEEFREIEMKCTDPGFRLFCIQELAAKYRKSERQLESIFYKYLVDKEDETISYINQVREEIGDKVNAWYLHGFIPKGAVVLIHSLGGLGKSRLCYEFTYRLVSGQAWGDFQVTAPRRKVLLVQTDEQTTDTMRAIADRWTDSQIDCHVAHKSRWSVEHVARLKKEIQEHKFDVIVIDSVTSVNKHSIFSENETEYARPILLLKEIAEELGCTFIIIHHSNSAGQSRGTKAIFNSVSLVLSLQLPSEGSSRTSPNRLLCIEKSRFQRPTNYRLRYEIDEETHQWNWICDGEVGEDETDRPVKERILEYLASNRNTPWEAREIYDRIGGTYDNVRRACYRLANDGLIGRKRSQRDSKAWGYFLTWEGSDRSDRYDRDRIDDRITIGSNDQIQNQVSESNSVRSDHPIVKNAPKNSQITAQKNEQINDRMIRSDRSHPETTINHEFQESNRSDHPIRSLCDRDAIVSDRIESDRVLYKYVGNDPMLKPVCVAKEYLEIVEVKGNTAIVSAPGWVMTKRIPLSHLQQILE